MSSEADLIDAVHYAVTNFPITHFLHSEYPIRSPSESLIVIILLIYGIMKSNLTVKFGTMPLKFFSETEIVPELIYRLCGSVANSA